MKNEKVYKLLASIILSVEFLKIWGPKGAQKKYDLAIKILQEAIDNDIDADLLPCYLIRFGITMNAPIMPRMRDLKEGCHIIGESKNELIIPKNYRK